MVVEILLFVSLLVNVGLGFVLHRYITRLFQYDDLYKYLIDDVETNLVQFDRMRKSSFLSDDDEVRKAHKSMMVMSARLDEFATRMEEISGEKLRKRTKQMTPINVTAEAEKISNG